MPDIPTERIRNVAVVGHSGAGKTSLVESLLSISGTIQRMGRVEDGSTVSDSEPEEHRRQLSIGASLCPLEWTPHISPGAPEEQPHKINLIDCPGEPDLAGQVEAALRVADLALFVVSAADGVQAGTEQAWKAATELGIPRMFFVNKCDRERADAEGVIDSLKTTFGAGVAPLELPIGKETEFRGIVDLLSDTAETYDGDGKGSTGPVPADMEVAEHEVHDQLVEGIVVADDDLMTRYLEGEVPSVEELERALAHGVDEGLVFPVVLGSATKRIAVDRLADFLCEIGPSPLDRPPAEVEAGDTLAEVKCDENGPPLAVVWRTIDDRFLGKLTVARCLSGTITPDTVLRNTRSGVDEKLHSLLWLRGASHEPASRVVAGDLFAVPKLSATGTGDTLTAKDQPVRVHWPSPPPAAFQVAIAPKSKGDDDKLMTALHRLIDEDPDLSVTRNAETHQTVVGGRGETHVQIALERLKRKFSVEVEQLDLIIPFRETITSAATAEGRYKKQTGGHGQYGVCTLTIEPRERGEGFEFSDEIVGGAIPRNLIPAVEKGVLEAMERGGVHGYKVVDVKVRCTDGKYHSVDSSEMSFKMAGSLAFNEAMAKASPTVLEPISVLTVTVPNDLQGDVMGDLNSRRGRVQNTDVTPDGSAVITALVPAVELTRYAIDLRSMTGARGRFAVEHSHYDPLPSHLIEKLPKKGE